MNYKNALKKIIILSTILFSVSVFAATEQLVPDEFMQNLIASYSQAEKEAIEKDRANIADLCMSQVKQDQKELIYIATAGGPGASKSTILESYMQDKPGFVYIDPDQRALRFMINTYLQETTLLNRQQVDPHELLTNAYNKWRDASNYIASSILNEAYDKGLAIAHGTTSTAPIMKVFYEKLKAKGYKIVLLVCFSSEENRLRAIEHREKNQFFIQSTPEDVIQKEEMFFDNLPIYFEFADEIHFFQIEDFAKGWVEAGNYSKERGLELTNEDFEDVEKVYDAYRAVNASEDFVSHESPGCHPRA